MIADPSELILRKAEQILATAEDRGFTLTMTNRTTLNVVCPIESDPETLAVIRRNAGRLKVLLLQTSPPMTCEVEGCDKPDALADRCRTHFYEQVDGNDPDDSTSPRRAT